MDQGIIANFKHYYRRSIAFSAVELLDNESGDCLSISIKDAIDRTVQAWKSVKASTISNCFTKAGHILASEIQLTCIGENDPVIDPILWRRIAGAISFNEYLAVDENLATQATKCDEEIIENAENSATEEPDSEEECDEPEIPPAIPSSKCIKKGFSDLRLYLQAHSKDTNSIQALLNSLEDKFDELAANNQVQTSIDQFFK
jgi:hypothetical protein